MPTPVAVRGRNWRRILFRTTLAALLFATILSAALVLGLRSPAVRRAVLERAGSVIEKATGVRATARDFSLEVLRGKLELEGLAVGTPEAVGTPDAVGRLFLKVERASATVSWGSLFGDRALVRSLRLERPRLDLGSPLPDFVAGSSRSAGRGVDVLELELIGGTILSGKLPAELETWLDAVAAEDVELTGRYTSKRLELEIRQGKVVAQRSGREPIEAAITASFRSDEAGFAVERLELAGDSLGLEASGGKLTAEGPFAFAFELHAALARLFPDLTSGGRLEASGHLRLARGVLTGALEVDARELPGELWGPWLVGPGRGAVTLTGTLLDVDADLDVDVDVMGPERREILDRLSGQAALDWRRQEERLVKASVRSLGEPGHGLHLAFEGEVLPSSPGRREVAGEILAPGWLDIAAGELRGGRLDLELPDLTTAAERLGLNLEAGGFRPAGEIRASAVAEGPLLSPAVRLEAAWLVDGEPLAVVEARSPDGVGAGQPIRLAFATDLLPASAGRRAIEGEILVAEALRDARLRDVRLDLEIPDLSAATEEVRWHWRQLLPGREVPDALLALTGGLRVAARVSGPVVGPGFEVEASWRPDEDESVRLAARGEAAAEAPFLIGKARLEVTDVAVDRLAAIAGAETQADVDGKLSARLDFKGSVDAHRAALKLGATGLRFGGASLDKLQVEARSDGVALELREVAGTLGSGQIVAGRGRFELGRNRSAALLRAGELHLELSRPRETIERITAAVRLDGGTVEAEIASQETAGRVHLRVPLAALAARPALAAVLAALTTEADPGAVWLGLSGVELEPFVALLNLDEDTPRPRARLDGSLTLDLQDPVASAGTIEISGLTLEDEAGTFEVTEDLRFELRDRRLELRPARLFGAGRGGADLKVLGHAELAAGWRPGDGLAALVTDLDVDFAGTFEATALNPLLGGLRASGPVAVELEARGSSAELVAQGRLDGSAATFFFATPYATKIEGPVMELSAHSSGTILEAFRARLNGGDLEASGRLDRQQGLALAATFRDVRYRLDYGLKARLSGELELRRPPEQRGRVTGGVVVERGDLRRDLQVDREMLSLFLAPDLTGSAAAGFSESVDLDLSLTTAEGVRIKNNLAQLHADWSRLRIRGTLARPLVEGRIDIDPGGRITAYGQTVRIDEAAVEFSGDPAVGPRIVLETTSSLEDPSIRENRRGFPSAALGEEGPGAGSYWERQQDAEVDVSQELTQGLMSYYTDRFAGALSSGLLSTELSLRPLPIFGETDTEARLTAIQRLSPNADLIYSVNPREAEGQTYILDLHGFDVAPSLAAQVFNNDEDREGVTLVQTLELGGGRRSAAQGPRLAGIAVEVPEEISRRRLRRALGLRKGDPFPAEAAFDVEIDALEHLRRQGHPGAEVSIDPTPDGRRVSLGVTVEPGPRVRFIFEGEKPPRAARGPIVQPYYPEDEATSLEALRLETVKALRGEGYLEPVVEVTAEGGTNGSRTVRINTRGGRRIDPGSPRFEGLPADEAELLASQFDSRLVRVELAAASPGAERYLRQTLAALGYPDARTVSRQLSEGGDQLVVRLEAGARQHLSGIEIAGLPSAEAARLAPSLPVREGGPARPDLITRAVHVIEDELRALGHATAAVHAVLEPLPSGGQVLRLEVEPGPLHRIAGVRFEGLEGTREAWATRIAGLEPRGLFRDQDLGEARRRLSRTGRFERIRTGTEPPPQPGVGSADAGAADAVATTVVFDVEERPRYLVAYGVRWESGESVGAVVDAVDQNFLGRGTTLGTRATYAGIDDRSLRLYHAVPRIRGSKSNLEVFLEGKNEETEGIIVDSVEGWAQITSPLTRRAQNRFYVRYQDLFFREAKPRDIEPAPGQRVVVPSLGWQLSYDTTKSRPGTRAISARRPDGLFFGLDLVGAHEDLGADFSALALFSQVKLFHSLAEIRRGRTSGPLTWAQSYRIGLLEPFGDTEIPIINKLRAGGEFSVRGYRTESLGPLDDTDNALGGEVFLIVNQELHFPLRGENLSGLVFFDAGNVWESSDTLDSQLFTSVGLGLRASTPAGPLRLDVAFPLDRREGDDSFKVYIGFGNIF